MYIERTQGGKTIGKQRAYFKEGRPPKYNKKNINHALDLLESYFYKQVEELTEIRNQQSLDQRKNKPYLKIASIEKIYIYSKKASQLMFCLIIFSYEPHPICERFFFYVLSTTQNCF